MPRSVARPSTIPPLLLIVCVSGVTCEVGEPGVDIHRGALGATSTRLDKLYPGDARALIQFGAVALVGDELLVGAPANTIVGDPGAVYVYRRQQDGWTQSQKLIPGNGTDPSFAGIRFGLSVSGHGDVLAVGAPGPDPGAGSVFIYHRQSSGWVFGSRLLAPAADANQWFGQTVLVADGLIAAAAGFNWAQPRAGSVQLYRQENAAWVPDQRLQASAPLVSDQFGSSIGVEGDLMAVGAPNSLQGPGRVFVFQRAAGMWNERQILTENTTEDTYGWALDLRRDQLIVGAPRVNSTPPYNLGALYAYGRAGDTWQRQQTLTVPMIGGALPPSGTLGYGVARVADTLLATDNKRLYLWKLVNGQWTEHAWLAAEPGPEPEFWAGDRIAMSPQVIVGGNRNSNARGSLAGVVHYSFAHPIALPPPPDGSPDTTPDAAAAPDLAPDLALDLPPDAPPPPPPDASPVADAEAEAVAADSAPTDLPAEAPVSDAGTDREAGDAGDGGEEPACTCRLGPGPGSVPAPLALLVLAVIVRGLRRRR